MIRWGRILRTLVIALLVAVVVSLPVTRVVLEVANGYVAAWLLQLNPSYGENVVVVVPDEAGINPAEDIGAVLQRIDAAAPSKVAVVLDGSGAVDPAALPRGAAAVVPILPDTARRASAPPDTATGGPWVRPAHDGFFGHFRATGPGRLAPEAALPPFEEPLLGREWGTYWIGYLPTGQALPVFGWRDILDGAVPDRFIAGKTVVVAMTPDDHTDTPDLRLVLVSQPVPPATHVAQAVQARLDGRTLLSGGVWLATLIILIAGLEAGVVLTRLRDRAGSWIYPLSVGLIFGVTLIAAWVADVMFPFAEALVAFSLAWFAHRMVLDTNRRRRQRRQLIRLDLAVADAVETTPVTAEAWHARVDDTARTLGLTGHSFVLRRRFLRGSVQVASGGGDVSDIALDRIRTALRAGVGRTRGTTLVPLSGASDGEELWQVDMRSPEGCRAGWLVRCPEGILSASPPRRAMLIAAAERLLALHPSQAVRSRFATPDEEIAARARILAHEAATLVALTHTAVSAFAVFGLVGGFIRQNDRMREVGQEAGIDFSALSLLEALSRTSGLDQDEVGTVLSNLIADGESRRLPTANLETRRRFILRLSLDEGRAGDAASDALGPVMLCELLDVTESERLNDARRSVAQFFDQRLRNDFEAINLVTEMLHDPALDETIRERLLERLRGVTQRMTARMETFDTALGDMAGNGATAVGPQELRRALDEACDILIRDGRETDVRIDYDRPVLLSLVRAGAEDLTPVLRDLGKLCLADAPRGSAVKVMVTETPGTIETVMVSTGHGLPQEVAAIITATDGARLPGELGDVARAAEAVRHWGGHLSLDTGLERGISCRLTLEKVV